MADMTARMKQTQQQSTAQRLALSAGMHLSLHLLHKDADEVLETLRCEVRRNPFLRLAAPPASVGHDPHRIAAPETALDEIGRQIGLIRMEAGHHALAEQLLHCLDDRGFLSDPVEEMCAYLDVAPSLLVTVVDRLQRSLEPVGIFAWSLKDCFRIQLSALDRLDPLMARLLDRLDLVARVDIEGIMQHCGVDQEDAEEMVEDIRALRPAPLVPRPALEIEARQPELVLRVEENAGTAALNPSALPSLLADDGLFDTVTVVEIDASAQAYYRDCYQGACAIVQSMQRRANTLLRIGQVIADTQTRFLRTGREQDRKPLTMADIGDVLGLHRSTVSRALRNCLVQTDHGILAAATFIVRPLSSGSEGGTREQALRRLSVILSTEDRTRPYSDEALAELLARAHFVVNRRTVTKYRGLLGIPGAYARRALKRFS